MLHIVTTIAFIEHIKHIPYLTLVLTLNMFPSVRREDDVDDQLPCRAWPGNRLILLIWRGLLPVNLILMPLNLILMPLNLILLTTITASESSSWQENVGNCREK